MYTISTPEQGMQCYSQEVIDAMEEAKVLSQDPAAKRYQSFSDALEDLEE